MPSRPNIVLMGLRGSGKTTIGRMLAARLAIPFVDLDDITPALLGRPSVAEAWTVDGEPAFRAAEVKALDQVLAVDGRVVALGGGTPTAPGAADRLREQASAGRCVLVYLRASADELRDRLRVGGAGANRPSLTGADPLDEIAAVLARRDPIYSALASHVIEVGGKISTECMDAIITAIGSTPAP